MLIRIVCPYDSFWPAEASSLAGRIAGYLTNLGAKIEHIGSTAVPGLEAKPVLDLLIGLSNRHEIDEAIRRLSSAWWQDFGDAGVAGRRYMRNRRSIASNLHIVLIDKEHWVNNLALRDYLRSHPAEVTKYAAAKRAAVNAGHRRLLTYSAAKAETIAELMVKSL